MYDNFPEIGKVVTESDNFLILTHTTPDGDAFGSAAALCNALRELGKTAWLLPNPEMQSLYERDFLKYSAPDDYHSDMEKLTVIAVDTSSKQRLQINAGRLLENRQVAIAFDHHATHMPFALLSHVEPDRAACGEIIFDFLVAAGIRITAETARLLYIAISSDTGCFRLNNTTSSTFSVAAELLKTGIDFEAINRRYFITKSKGRLALEMLMLPAVEYYKDGAVGLSVVSRDMIAASGAEMSDFIKLSDVVQQIEGIEMSIVLQEQKDGSCDINVRTFVKPIAAKLCGLLGGGGHIYAAGAQPKTDAATARERILDALDKVWA